MRGKIVFACSTVFILLVGLIFVLMQKNKDIGEYQDSYEDNMYIYDEEVIETQNLLQSKRDKKLASYYYQGESCVSSTSLLSLGNENESTVMLWAVENFTGQNTFTIVDEYLETLSHCVLFEFEGVNYVAMSDESHLEVGIYEVE